jgi:hypothetical protein
MWEIALNLVWHVAIMESESVDNDNKHNNIFNEILSFSINQFN